MNAQNLRILKALQSGSISVEEAKQQISSAVNVKASSKIEEKNKIAIIGMSGRYPDAMNLAQYWENLSAGRNSIKEVPSFRWNIEDYYDATPYRKGKTYCKWLGAVDDIEYFDPSFFSIPPAEAELMDPQHRLFLQEAYSAFEDAGYNTETLSNKKCGVYLGIMSFEYGLMLHGNSTGMSATMGNSYSIAAARIAYHLNLKGPAIALDTACSSSMVSIHLACQALLNKETDMALAGGVSLYLTPDSYISMCSGGMLAKDGQCKTLDTSADGFVPGEGVGAVVLKRLSDAIRDKDNIHGVIIGSGINQDGRTNGITAPSVKSQTELERDVYSRFNIQPENIQYVELHGTGTKLGDPIELEALSAVYTANSLKKNYCGLGSVKSNIGHASAAAGIAGIHKVLLSMKYRKIAPTLNVEIPTPHFDFKESPFYINKELKDWKTDDNVPMRAAISSFGFSGTNAHMVIEAYVNGKKKNDQAQNSELIILSAKSSAQLNTQAHNIVSFLKKENEIALRDLAYTLQVGRDEMEYRLAFNAHTINEVAEHLTSFIQNDSVSQVSVGMVESALNGHEILDDNWYANIDRPDRLAKIAQLWLEGKKIDWSQLYTDIPQRISLPTYPFARERYWLSTETASTVQEKPSVSSTREPKFLAKKWLALEMTEKNIKANKVILLCSTATMSLAQQIAEYFNEAEIVEYNLADDFCTSWSRWVEFDGLIDVLGCGEERDYTYKRIPLIQQLVEFGKREGLKLMGVTQGLEAFDEAFGYFAGADTAALYRTLEQEYRHLTSLHLDVAVNEESSVLAKQIADEFFTPSHSSEISIRESIRYQPILKEQNMDMAIRNITFSSEDVLWITGGTRGIGLQCAYHFVKHSGLKKIVLTGREKIPPRTEWSLYLNETSCLSNKLKAIQELEALGAQVQVGSVLLTDKQEVQKFLVDVKHTLGKITAFIHSAGVTNKKNPAFIRKSKQEIEEITSIKTIALDTVYECLKEETLKFFIMFSSVASAIPSLGTGQTDYAMANAYMDYFATSCQAKFPVLSIQWSSWQETGFGEVKSKSYLQTGLLSQTNEEGLKLLDILLANNIRGVILPAMVDRSLWHPDSLLEKSIKYLPLTMDKNSLVPPSTTAPFSSKTLEDVLELFVDILSRELKMDKLKIKLDTSFQQLGIDSIILIQLVAEIDKTFGISLDPTTFIEQPTPRSFCEYLVKTHSKDIEEQFLSSKEKVEVKTFAKKVAIVGMACHFPGASNITEFWNNLKIGKDSISKVPAGRWSEAEFYHPRGYLSGKSISNSGGFLDRIEEFDPGYFNIPESLAPYIDPLQRQWLEVSVEALNDAGIEKETLSGTRVGVFAGARTSNFAMKYPGSVKDRIVGIGQNFITAHLAHIYNFKGPNMVIDTACSSSLTAIHQAAASILSGESEIALAGGVDILLDEGLFVGLSNAKILSPDGRCKTFDADANGIGIGEGCGVLVLKSLEQAITDNQKIYALIDSSVINNDGNTMGVTTPNPEAQTDLITSAIEKANINPKTITYVETHGTGTLIGDPIELRGLTRALNHSDSKEQFCGVGSVKSNIGHLLCAAGAASIIKVALSIVNRNLPPTLHCETPNPRFNFSNSPLYPVLKYQPWEAVEGVLRGGISSFGLGGNNAHVIISDEGIPETNRAVMDSRTETVVFNKRFFWPSSSKEQPALDLEAKSLKTTQENDFMRFFIIDED
ncbi:type I polyketide synthase [Chryseobacterium sp. c4a]|uniref:type I polyketide synthase n=1 Tax=Chryseobacterium sp. c4a TaxID=1573582 RepID=UPI001357DD4D|nr:type I polyketide synthase [Chryseobacterium sp. c4a]